MAKKKKQVCDVCEKLVGPENSAILGFSEVEVLYAHLAYLMSAINYWMHFSGYEFGDEKNEDIPIHDAQMIDALSEIIEYRIREGGDKKQLMNWKIRRIKNFWSRTGRRRDEPFTDNNQGDF